MSTAARVAPTPGFKSTSFDKKKLTQKAQPTAVIACPKILLIGRQGAWSEALLTSLQKFDSELSFVAPLSVTPDIVKESGYTVVLLDSTVPADQRRDIALALIGSNASVFYTFPVENGCWWLPALQFGKDCHGSPAFRRREFHAEIERLLGVHAEV